MIYLVYIYDNFACMYTCVPHVRLVPEKSEEGRGPFRTRVSDDHGC